MTVLADIDTILVRASHIQNMKETRIVKIMLDIAIPQNTGHPAKYSEQCLCPQGYEGLSCETCARGYYRDNFDRSDTGSVGVCKPCECSGNEQTCKLENDKLNCVCKDGFEGEKCDKVVGSPGKSFSNHGKGPFKYYVIMILNFFDPPTHLIIRRHHFLYPP